MASSSARWARPTAPAAVAGRLRSQLGPQLYNVDDTELVMDLLRQGEQVKVLEPPALVQAVRQRLAAAAAQYEAGA